MLTARIQAQLICNRLAGKAVCAKVEDFSEPWSMCWQAIEGKSDKNEMVAALGQALDIAHHPENARLLTDILQLKPGEASSVKSLAELKDTIRPVEWLWKGYIPRGVVTVLGAMKGAGKSALMQDFARRITSPHKETWPDGQPLAQPGANVFYLDAEGMPEAIKERAIAWKMDISKFYYKYKADNEIYDLGQQRYQDMIYEAVYAVQPELILVDSLGSINTKGENNIEDVRIIFSFLTTLARDFHTGLILSHHLRKRFGVFLEGTEITLDDFRGSGHITQMARSVLAVSVIQTSDENNRNGPRKLEVVSTNLGPYPSPIGFEFEPCHPDGFMLKWGEAPKPYRAPTKEDECVKWLLDTLEDAPLSIGELTELGKNEDFSRGTIIRARKKLGSMIQGTKGHRDPDNKWKLVKPEEAENTF